MKTPAELPGAGPSAAQRSRRGGRETVDALVVAFVLAFLIRTFQAEAFVIPTGSMAPTLMGRHKDVFCEQCGVRYRVNSSDDASEQFAEVQRRVARGLMSPQEGERYLAGQLCVGGACPQCRYLMPLSDAAPSALLPPGRDGGTQTGDYSGDRLVVSKYAYSFAAPERWDVAVFKYPGDSETNYIKRITGIPGEELRVFQGDLYTRPLGSDNAFTIARKPAGTLMAMRQFLHDTNHEPRRLIDAGWPLGWSGDDGWSATKTEETSKKGAPVYRVSYAGESTAGATRWLRFRHTPPTEPVWNRVLEGEEPLEPRPKPQLVTDFTPYNTRLNLDQAVGNGVLSLRPRLSPAAPGRSRVDDLGRLGIHWVGDLVLEADLNVGSTSGEVTLELVEAGTHYGMSLDVASGKATLWRGAFESDDRDELASTTTSAVGSGRRRLRLANVDNRLVTWLDGRLLDLAASFDDALPARPGPAAMPRTSDADEGDLAPAGVAVTGGKVTIDRLRLWRDGYYIARRHDDEPGWVLTTDLPPGQAGVSESDWYAQVQALPHRPEDWPMLAKRRARDFPVREGQLFVMGDNSGWSLDARLWAGGNGRDGGRPGGAYLEQTQLVGKAICVYWPHSWYRLPVGFNPRTRLHVPLWPNFADMRLVR